jgi:aldehyde oxidoreductase
MDVTVTMTLNGNVVAVTASPAARLAALLRDRLGLTGTKIGCDAGDCGACTVLIDGAVACACMVPLAQAANRAVVTVEGIAGHSRFGRALQRAFLANGAAQCGICTPGMLVAAAALLESEPEPTQAQMEAALSGVLCRCTGYRKIIAAVRDAGAGVTHDAPSPASGKAVGARIERLDGLAKVNGTEAFGADSIPEGALLVRAIRSPHHHADFRLGDIEAYVHATPGLVLVLTAADIPGRNLFGVLAPYADQPVFAEVTTRFKGEPVAVIVGQKAAVEALDLAAFPVTWTKREALLTIDQALAETAPRLHDGRPGNILIRGRVKRGDPEAALKTCDAVVSGTFETGFVEHAYIEPEAATIQPPFSALPRRTCGLFRQPAAAASAPSSIYPYSPSSRWRPGSPASRRRWSTPGRNQLHRPQNATRRA